MRIEKNFSSISELEERAFCEGYMYAQKEFAEEAEKSRANDKYKPEIGAGAGMIGLGYGSLSKALKLHEKKEKVGKLRELVDEKWKDDLKELGRDMQDSYGYASLEGKNPKSAADVLKLEEMGDLSRHEKEQFNYFRNSKRRRLDKIESLEKKARRRAGEFGAGGIGLGIVGTSALAKGLYDYKNRNKE